MLTSSMVDPRQSLHPRADRLLETLRGRSRRTLPVGIAAVERVEYWHETRKGEARIGGRVARQTYPLTAPPPAASSVGSRPRAHLPSEPRSGELGPPPHEYGAKRRALSRRSGLGESLRSPGTRGIIDAMGAVMGKQAGIWTAAGFVISRSPTSIVRRSRRRARQASLQEEATSPTRETYDRGQVWLSNTQRSCG